MKNPAGAGGVYLCADGLRDSATAAGRQVEAAMRIHITPPRTMAPWVSPSARVHADCHNGEVA